MRSMRDVAYNAIRIPCQAVFCWNGRPDEDFIRPPWIIRGMPPPPTNGCLREAKQETANQAAHTDPTANQKRCLFAAITAHFDFEKKKFVDNLLKKTKDILIHGHRDWIERELLCSKKISESATDDEHVKKLRGDLLERVERL
jgi:hypothetical protein